MTLSSLEAAASWANRAVVVFTVLAAVSGIFALYFSNKLGAAKDAADKTVLAEQQKRTAEAEHALLQLKESIKDRTISTDQAEKLVSLLKGGPNGPIGIIWSADVADSFRFAGQIREVLSASGWLNVTIGEGLVANAKDLAIAVHDSKTAPAYAAFLQESFGSVGIPLEWEYSPRFPTNLVRIEIGHKPKIP